MYFMKEYELWEQLGQGQNVAAMNESGRCLCLSRYRCFDHFSEKKVTAPFCKSRAP